MRHVLAALLLSSALLSTATHAAPSLASMNVRLSDLSAGSVQQEDHLFTAAQYEAFSHLPAGQYAKFDLVRTSDRVFFLDDHGNTNAQLDTGVDLYGSVRQAHAWYLRLVRATADGRPSGIGPSALKALRVGEERASFSQLDTANPTNPADSDVVFRRGRYVVTIVSLGTRLTFTAGLITRLAPLVDGRIQAAQ